MTAAPTGDPGGGAWVEMRGESRDSSTFTQIGQVIQPPLPEQAFRPWAELAVPAGLSNLPSRPGLFVGRAHELARLDAAMAGPGGVVVQAVHGLGGVGKSTLATRWAAAHAADYLVTWWITAATPADIDAGLAALAVALQPALTGVLPLEALREGAVQWLAAHSGWLVILDNVTDPADVAPLLARAPAGRYLITSRRASGWHGTAVPVRLDVLDPAEAQALLAAILSPDRPREADSAAELCEELGFLPLAIEQVGAYLAQAGASPREYLDLLARYPAAMYQAAAEGGDAARTIARIWRVTLDRLADDPLAGQVLRILAWYAPDAIPRTLLDGLADPPAVLRAVGRLAAYSMLTADAGTLAMHRLVQAVSRTPDPGDPHREPQAIDDARDQATRQLADALPGPYDPAGWPAWRMLLPHIDALASHAPPDIDTDITAYLLNEAGAFLHSQRQVARAAGHLQRALADRQRLLGENHPDTLTSRDNLAGTYRAAGDLGRAIPLFERALADWQRVLGDDHPQTLTSGNNLAYAYRAAGDLGRAIPLFERALADRVRVLGDDHPDTLTSRDNLAGTYRAAGDLGRAIPLAERALADRVRVLGDDHPDTLTSRNNLAYAYQSAGDLGRAIPLFKQALADRQRVLGDDHPQTLTSRNNLAYAYRAAGDSGQAIALYEQTLADRVRVLGDDHPDTLASRSDLAGGYKAAGDLGRAIPLFKQTLADRQRVLGADHPHTLTSRGNLAGAYQAAGDLERAIPLYEQTLTDRQRVLGADHPHTLTSRGNLAGAYQAAGDLGRAIPLYEQTLADSVRVLGADHPQTKIVRSNLAAARQHPQ
jgi:tetratricopeptide (TPR) repeat protein